MHSNDPVSNNNFHGYIDLSKQIEAVQRSIAVERGENHKFRKEVRAILRLRGAL